MKTLARTLNEQAGEPVLSPWEEFSQFIDVRKGDAITILGAPMSNKSNLLLNWTVRGSVPAIYGNFDTPQIDMTARALSILSGEPSGQVLQDLHTGKYDKYADSMMSLWFTEDADCLTPDRDGLTLMDELVVAYDEFWGEGPSVIVLDNLSDVAAEVHHVELQRTFKAARDLARRTNTVVFCLHHVRRPGDDEKSDPAAVPIRLNDGVGAGERDAATVLGLWKPKYGNGTVLRIAHLKSKRKRAEASGAMYMDFALDQSRALVGDVIDGSVLEQGS